MSITQKRTSKLFAILLTVAIVLVMLPSMTFATNFDNDHDRISISTGEPVYIQWDSSTSSTGIVTAVNSSYYPNSFVLYAQNTDGAPTSSNATITYLYDTEGGKAYNVSLTGAATISVTLADSTAGGNTAYTLSCFAPVGTAPDSTKPTAVNGYLPIGQFASGSGWGAIYTDGTNTGATKKFISGYSSTGVSLGAAGGYAEFAMNIVEAAANPYGVDFVVYGNPFNGNPEAGSVKVFGYTSETDQTGEWYELAGSLYYNANTVKNATVTYKKIETASGEFTSTGIWYKLNNNAWTKFNTNTSVAWWPTESENYDDVWGSVDGVTWNTTNNEITFSNTTLVKDTDNTNDYQFGYFDIRSNGSSYGTAVNPYATAPTANSGGDGFDLAWAVNTSGQPVALHHATKVRVYTSAAMKPDGSGIFTTPSIFGETSAEVCGIYAAQGTGSGISADAPIIEVDGVDLGLTNSEHLTTFELPGCEGDSATISVSGDTYIFINGSAANSATINLSDGNVHPVQIITQSGNASPYIILLLLSK